MKSQDIYFKEYNDWHSQLFTDYIKNKSIKGYFFSFIKKYKTLLLVIVIIFLPLAILDFIKFINCEYNFLLYYNISKDTFISFIGSYIGGLTTLIGVIMTIRYSYTSQKRQLEILNIQKECDSLLELIKISNIPQFCNKKINEFYACIGSNNEEEHIQSLIKDMYEYINNFQYLLIDIHIISNISNFEEKCYKYRNFCKLHIIKKEFNTIFNTYYNENNMLIYQLINLFNLKLQNIKMHSLDIKINKQLSEEELKNKKIEIENQHKEITCMMKNINNTLQDTMQKYALDYTRKMSTLIKYYKHERINSIHNL